MKKMKNRPPFAFGRYSTPQQYGERLPKEHPARASCKSILLTKKRTRRRRKERS
ncbi:MAG: hypothetical protein IJC98_07940 [Clostridia bacterium]|nr:hypothetical protein [Clostridia bacterium]